MAIEQHGVLITRGPDSICPNGYGYVYYTNSAFGGNSVAASFTPGMTVTVWTYGDGDNDHTLYATSIIFEYADNGFIKATATGNFTGVGYFPPKSSYQGTYGRGAYSEPSPNSVGVYGNDPSNFFGWNQIDISIHPGGSGGGETNINIGGEEQPPSSGDMEGAETAFQDKVNESGAIDIEAQEYTSGQTSQFWDDWKIKIDNIPTYADGKNLLRLGNVQSKGENWDNEAEVTFDGTWYKTSSIKQFMDAAMTGFATFAAFLMPYYELKKGAPNG
ncbi:MAG: hypothetical protein ACF8OB_04990 [Phycisphaeraceae bacterium JB051]